MTILFFTQTIQINAQNQKFLTKNQIRDFYGLMISEIEFLDAEAIETRNESREIKWNKIKKHYKKQFLKSKNWNDLKNAYTKFGNGFVNLHSSFRFFSPIKKKSETILSNVKLGYEYPEINFFERESKQNVTHINKTPIKKAFKYFLNYECRFNSDIGCQMYFVSQFRRGKLLVKGEFIESIRLENGKVLEVIYKKASSANPPNVWKDFDNKYADWKLIKKGYRVAVLKKDNVALVKIIDFIYKRGSERDFRCTKSIGEGSMCNDILLIRESLNSIKDEAEYLILDVQNNRGGRENTAFIAEFAQKPFYDLQVRYKKTDLLKNDELRKYLFYYSGRAESWYQRLVKNGTISKIKDGEYLPQRGDFCRGSKYCEMEAIEPNKNDRKYKKIAVLTNQMCVSSCDDLVWRMKEFANAEVIGQPQSADATYSRIVLAFYIDKNGKIAKKYFGDGQKIEVDGQKIATMRIPYSRTVDANGELIQGKPAKLSRLVPVTKNNFSDLEKDVLREAVHHLKANNSAKL